MAQLINCEFKIKITMGTNMEESSEENIKAVGKYKYSSQDCRTWNQSE